MDKLSIDNSHKYWNNMKIFIDMNNIYDNKVNNIDVWNWLHGILNPSIRTKNINGHYSPILHVCMNCSRVREKYKTLELYWIVGVVPQL